MASTWPAPRCGCSWGTLCVYSMFLIALSSIACSVLLAIGPLFIVMLLFDATRRYFEAWIGQLANYALITILTVLIAALLLRVVSAYASQTAARGSALLTVDALDMVMMAVLVFMRQVMPIAAGLAGGIALNSFGLVSRGISWAKRQAVSGAVLAAAVAVGAADDGMSDDDDGARGQTALSYQTPSWRGFAMRVLSARGMGYLLSLVLGACSSSGSLCPRTAAPNKRGRDGIRVGGSATRRSTADAMSDSESGLAPDLYLREAEAWDRDRVASLRLAIRRAWQVATAAGGCAVLCILALVLLLPLKRTDAFVIRVDSSTGVVDIVPAYAGHLDASQSVTRYFLTHYVLVCRRFTMDTAPSDYEECGAFHGARLNQSWAASWARTNPQSPLNLHRDGSEVSVQIESVSFLQRLGAASDLAQVRYVTLTRSSGGQQQSATHWIATIQYAYAPPSSDRRFGAGIRWDSKSSTL